MRGESTVSGKKGEPAANNECAASTAAYVALGFSMPRNATTRTTALS
jgi:hypothetical protein